MSSRGEILFYYNLQTNSEIDTESNTSQRLNGYYTFYPSVIDLLFSLQYVQGDWQDLSTDHGSFQARADIDYSQLPYTFNSIFLLTNKGYYLEATILVRQVFETLVQLRYFHNNPNLMKEHILGKFISFKSMMEDITTNDIYRCYRTLCSYSHGFVMKDLQRTFREDTDNPTRIQGNFYFERNCTIVTNYIFDLLIGVLIIYKGIFNCNTLDESEELSKRYTDVLDWCIGGRESHMRENTDSIAFHNNMDGLIFVE